MNFGVHRRKNSHSLSAQVRHVGANPHSTRGHSKGKKSSKGGHVLAQHEQSADVVSNCSAYTEHQSSIPKEPMIAHKLPDRPWKNVATDLFELDNEHYLIVVDYYSRYFELERMSTTTSSAVINKMKAIFTRHGTP